MVTKKKKKKKASISADDRLRAFITVHVIETIGDMPNGERAELVEGIATMFGPSLVSTVKAAALVMSTPDESEEEDEEYEDDEEDEEYEDEDEDEE